MLQRRRWGGLLLRANRRAAIGCLGWTWRGTALTRFHSPTLWQMRPDGPLQIEVEVDGVSSILTDLKTGLKSTAFTYDPPVVTRVFPANGPVTGGASVSVSGLNFGSPSVVQQHLQYEPADPPLQIYAGRTLMLRPVWMSDTSLVSVGPPGSGARVDFAVTVPWFVGQKLAPRLGLRFGSSFAFTYNAPVLTAATPANVPQSAVLESVQVLGTNFAPLEQTGATLCSSQVGWPCSLLPYRESPVVATSERVL